MKKTISFIGLGAMGSRIAKNLLEEGHQLTIYNRNPSKAVYLEKLGANIARSPKEATQASEIVVAMVTNDEASKDVWLDEAKGAMHGMDSSKIAVEMSTLSLAWTQRLAMEMKNMQFRFLDAPVVGTRPQAESRTLTILTGGEKTDFDALDEIFAAISQKAVHLGNNGSGCAMKLVVNTLFGIQAVAFAEVFSALLTLKFDKDKVLNMLSNLPVTSPIMKALLELMAAGKFDPMFPIDLVEKDFGYAQELVEKAGVPSYMTQSARKAYQEAQKQGFGKDNISGIMQLFSKTGS